MKLIAILILFIIFGIIGIHYVSAQTKDLNSNITNWTTLLLTGVAAGGISAAVNIIITITQIRHSIKAESQKFENSIKAESQKFENSIKAESLKNKVSVYSFFIFNLDRMLNNPMFLEGKEPTQFIKDTVDEMDAELKGKYYLMDTKSATKWMGIRHQLKHNYIDYTQVDKVIELRNILTKKYNHNITIAYKETMNLSLDSFDPEIAKLYQDPCSKNRVVNTSEYFSEIGGKKVYFESADSKMKFEKDDQSFKSEFMKNPVQFGY